MVVGVVYKGVSEYTVCILYGNWSHAYCTVVFTAVSCTGYVVLYLFYCCGLKSCIVVLL